MKIFTTSKDIDFRDVVVEFQQVYGGFLYLFYRAVVN